MQLIIYDNTNDYQVDVINLDRYDIEADDQHSLSDRIGYMAQQDLLLERNF